MAAPEPVTARATAPASRGRSSPSSRSSVVSTRHPGRASSGRICGRPAPARRSLAIPPSTSRSRRVRLMSGTASTGPPTVIARCRRKPGGGERRHRAWATACVAISEIDSDPVVSSPSRSTNRTLDRASTRSGWRSWRALLSARRQRPGRVAPSSRRQRPRPGHDAGPAGRLESRRDGLGAAASRHDRPDVGLHRRAQRCSC